MLAFYLDAALTKPVSLETPKRFLVPQAGGTKTGSVWLGDPASSLTYVFGGNVAIRPVGVDSQVQVSLKRSGDSAYAYPGTPILLAVSQLSSGVVNAVRIDLQLTVQAGGVTEFADWGLETLGYKLSTDGVNDPLTVAQATGYVLRRDQALPQRLRTLPLTREVLPTLPGFRIGAYRWRDEAMLNAQVLVPTTWDPNIDKIGVEKFIAGIGDNDDLKPEQVEEVADSLYLRISRGHYFTGHKGYYLPAQTELEFLPAHLTSHVLARKPQSPCPIFVGTYRLDSQGFYEADTTFRRITAVPITDPGYDWYYFDPTTLDLVLNRVLPSRSLFLGVLSGNTTEYFDVPTYPVYGIRRVYLDRGPGLLPLECPVWTFSREAGTVTVTKPSGGIAGEPVFVDVDPAVAVLYEVGAITTRQLPVELNPAFAGIASGYVYLQHRRQRVNSITLACDKPLIAIPATHQSVIGMVAYGPVYFDGDYALLTATAHSKVTGETVPGARLRAIVASNTFSGLLNYRDPLNETVEVVTGGDGTANLVFLPRTGYGTYLPASASNGTTGGLATTTVTNDTLVLPTAVPITQIRHATAGWLVTGYAVYKNNPLFGKDGATVNLGELPWQTDGTAGAAGYRTNGLRIPFRTGRTVMYPIQALDSAGRNYDHGSFSGTVKKLVYAAAVPTGATIGAYFVTYVQRVTLHLQAVDSNVLSNTLLLDMATPELIDENPWLILDDARADGEKYWDVLQGKLNEHRLGWPPSLPFTS